MPTLRPSRRRSRKPKGFTGAQLQYLTGDPQDGANAFELVNLETPTKVGDFDRLDHLLAKAKGIVSPERLAELQRDLSAKRSERERYWKDPHAAWAEDAAKYGI